MDTIRHQNDVDPQHCILKSSTLLRLVSVSLLACLLKDLERKLKTQTPTLTFKNDFLNFSYMSYCLSQVLGHKVIQSAGQERFRMLLSDGKFNFEKRLQPSYLLQYRTQDLSHLD
jgi:hypothetical protein